MGMVMNRKMDGMQDREKGQGTRKWNGNETWIVNKKRNGNEEERKGHERVRQQKE